MRGEVVQHYADLLRLRIVDVDQVAHTLGKVECSALLGDLDLPPGPMHIEEDEKIRRAVALVLVVVSLALSRARRQGQPLLRNELSRALVETDDGTCWFRLLGIEVEHVLHPGDVLAIDCRHAPHLLLPGLDVLLMQPAPDSLVPTTTLRAISSSIE